MDVALLIENKNNEVMIKKNKEEGKKRWNGKTGSENQQQNWGNSNKWRSNPNATPGYGNIIQESKPPDNAITQNVKHNGPRLSQSELLERSRKGLCFKCGEDWSKGHVCKMKNYRMMLVEQSEEESESEAESLEHGDDKTIPLELKTMQLSMLSKEGIPSLKTFKVKGKMKWPDGEQTVNVLIDSGASHNFISQELVEKGKIPY
ncbi:unnamed protein product, partial [Cuscuta epithymum]